MKNGQRLASYGLIARIETCFRFAANAGKTADNVS